MRRYVPYIAVAVLLPVVFLAPLVYKNWQKSRRERFIAETLQTVRQLDALSHEEALSRLTLNVPKGAVTFLFTGNTQGNLEPCGCYEGQSGGVARRATLVEQFRNADLPFLLVDAGLWLKPEPVPTEAWGNADSELERLKFQTYLRAMAQMEYHAATPSREDRRWGETFLFNALAEANLPVVSTVPLHSPMFPRHRLVNVGKTTVALLGAWETDASFEQVKASIQEAVNEVSEKADLVALLSSLGPALEAQLAREVDGLDLILSAAGGRRETVRFPSAATQREPQTIDGTLLAGSTEGGKTLGFAQWRGEGGWETGQITMTAEVPPHPLVAALVEGFYQQVADESKYHVAGKRLFAQEALENEPHNSFIGSTACQSCHQEEYEQWETTAHAAAYHTLLRAQRQFYPDCVACHVTGFGYETGFQIGKPDRQHLAEVGCETCHGPGRLHVSNPKASNTRAKVETKLCQQCHNEEHHPGFLQVAQHLRPKVDHTETLRNIKQVL